MLRSPAPFLAWGSSAMPAALRFNGGVSRPARTPNSALGAGIGKEERLAVDLVAGDGRLAFGADQPIDEGLPLLGLHLRMFGRIDQDDAILVEQLGVSFDQDLEIVLVGKAQPGAAIGEGVGPFANRRVERGAHAGARLEIPFAARRLGIDPGILPNLKLGLVRPRIVSPP